MSKIRDIGEDALIEKLIAHAPLDPHPEYGLGDDCAVVDPGPSSADLQLLKTDAIVEGIHFEADTPAKEVGWKAAARVISDFAAMGGHPERFLVTIALPSSTPIVWAEDLYRGLGDCLKKHQAILAGGETTSVPDGSATVISIAATGRVERKHLVLRSTGKPGDILLVTGSLGGSIHGKHLSFLPRIKESNWLVANYKPTAMMDLSDGLAKDLPRLAKASGCGFAIDPSALPRTSGCSPEQALGDGEDYELLIAVAPDLLAELQHDWNTTFPDLPLTHVGKLVESGKGQTLHGGWEHFAPSA